MKRLLFVWLIITGAFVLLAGCGGGPEGPVALVDQPTDQSSAPEGLRKIVIFNDTVNEPTRAAIVRDSGLVVVKDLPLVKGQAVILPDAAAERALKNRPEVVRVDNDDIYTIPDPISAVSRKPSPPPPAQSLPWGVDRIDADLAWATTKGSGIKVAILDTGIDLTHPDLKANIKGNYNAINPSKTGHDDNGHGTHVAGTVAAINNTVGVVGVAPEVSLYAVKVLDRNGSGWTSDIIEGIDWCIRNGIQVINMSFGGSFNQSMGQAVYDANVAGIVQVAAAGNSGVSPPTYPASYPETIAVSATDSANNFASFSNYGLAADDLAAPGVSISSTWKSGGYKTLSGTSMAAPHVTGAAALVIATGVTTDLTGPEVVKAVRTRLTSTAENVGLDVSKQGAGLVDAEKAVIGS